MVDELRAAIAERIRTFKGRKNETKCFKWSKGVTKSVDLDAF